MEPNQNGEIEIGYGTYDEFQGRVTNVASFIILEKNGFERRGGSVDKYHWHLE